VSCDAKTDFFLEKNCQATSPRPNSPSDRVIQEQQPTVVYQTPGTVPSYQPGIQPPNTPNTRKPEPSFSVCSVHSVVYQTQGLSPVTSREFNHRTRRTHGNQSPLSPCVPCFPWFTKPRGLSPVTSQESNHRTRRTHGNQSLLFPCVPWFPWLNKNQRRFTASRPEVILWHS
jgi:hypothetical protein